MRIHSSYPELVTQSSLDSNTGEYRVDYYFRGDLTLKVRLIGKLATRLSGMSLLEKDMRNALKWMTSAQAMAKSAGVAAEQRPFIQNEDRETFDTVKALFVAALTFYGKCFTGSTRGAGASREWLNADERIVHDKMMSLRHNFAAHSGAEVIEQAHSYLLFDLPSGVVIPTLPTVRIQPDVLVEHGDEMSFTNVMNSVLRELNKRHHSLAQKVFAIAYRQEMDFWRKAAKRDKAIDLDSLKQSSITGQKQQRSAG